jgi:heme exporter protein A
MIETRALTKTFGHVPVLRGIDLTINAGECVALFGPNGAGKTTLLRVLATLARPTLGAVRVAGHALPAESESARRKLGVVAHQPLVYGDLTAEENLRFYARMYRADEGALPPLLERVGLAARRRDLARTFSRGMLQRLALARALLHAPEVLLFDEPYTGLDPTGAALLDAVLAELRAGGRTVLMTSHDLAHGFALADRSLVLVKGRLALSARRDEMSADEFARRYGAIINQ